MIGTVLGNRYELIEIVGEGGMAVVYKAKDNKLNRWVAVKVLKKEFANNSSVAEKFKQEAKAIANLSDMNIVNVIDVGQQLDDSNYEIDYFVMEYIDGKTLKDIVRENGSIAYTNALAIGIQIAKALSCAHKNNIIHRDIKPQNILVTEHMDIKVTDFGIAKTATSSTITNTTTIVGSAHYLSPEQAKGIFTDIRTDIYSLGVVLYEMVTGKLPFVGDSPVAVAIKHIQEIPVSPKSINSAIPDSLNNLIMKAIEKDPILRYQNTTEIINDMQRIKDNPNISIVNTFSDSEFDKTSIIQSPQLEDIDKSTKIKKNNYKDLNEDINKTVNLKVNYEKDYKKTNPEVNKVNIEKKSSTKSNNKSNNKKIILSVVVCVIVLISIFGFTSFNSKNNKVILNNIVGKPLNIAEDELENLGLTLEVVKEQISDEKAGIILESTPKSGESVKIGSIIKVTISSGLEVVDVPDLRDMDVEYIKSTLDQKGIKYNIIEAFSDTIQYGSLISQDPQSGQKMPKNSAIEIVISIGEQIDFVTVKNYVGMNYSSAENALYNIGLNVSKEEKQVTDKSQNGIVLSQSIIDKTVEAGTNVHIVVGKYKDPMVDVTSYIYSGQILSEVLNILENSQIKYEVKGGIPQGKLSEYKVTSFTESIKLGGVVSIQIEKIKEEVSPPPSEEVPPPPGEEVPPPPGEEVPPPPDEEVPPPPDEEVPPPPGEEVPPQPGEEVPPPPGEEVPPPPGEEVPPPPGEEVPPPPGEEVPPPTGDIVPPTSEEVPPPDEEDIPVNGEETPFTEEL